RVSGRGKRQARQCGSCRGTCGHGSGGGGRRLPVLPDDVPRRAGAGLEIATGIAGYRADCGDFHSGSGSADLRYLPRVQNWVLSHLDALEGEDMLSTRRLSLVTLFLTASAAHVLGQDAQPKREKDVPYVPTREEVVAGMLKLGDVKKNE